MNHLASAWTMVFAGFSLLLAFIAGMTWSTRRRKRNWSEDNRHQLERQLEELSTLHAFATASANAENIDALIASMTDIVGESISPHYFGILLIEQGFLREHASYNHDPLKRNIERIQVRLGEGVVGNVAVSGEPTRDGDVVKNPVYLGFGSDTQSELAVPIKISGEVIGVINTESTRKHAFTAEDERLLITLANQLGIAMEKMRLFEKVQHLATTDALTNLANRRRILEVAHSEFRRAGRYRHPLSVMMMDVDDFKHCNDTYGHTVGDEVLKVVAKRSHDLLRENDAIGRYGGEEFLILLPETGPEGAEHNAARLCQAFSVRPISTSKGELRITVSIGVASYPGASDGVESLISRADQALYEAKNSGRNTYRVYTNVTLASGGRP